MGVTVRGHTWAVPPAGQGGELVIRRQEWWFSTWPQDARRPLGQGQASAPPPTKIHPEFSWFQAKHAGRSWYWSQVAAQRLGRCHCGTHATHAQHTHAHMHSTLLLASDVLAHTGRGHSTVARALFTCHPGLRSSSSFCGSVADAASQHPACGSGSQAE